LNIIQTPPLSNYNIIEGLTACMIAGMIVKSRGQVCDWIAGTIVVDGPVCQTCQDYEGMCHTRSEDDIQYGSGEKLCECPLSRTGNFCETVRGSEHNVTQILL